MPVTSQFKAPAGHAEKARAVEDRVRGLIRLGIWDIPEKRYEGWLQRFTGDEERFLAICLLDSIIYRSERQFSSALVGLMRGPVRWALGSTLVPGSNDADFCHLLTKRSTEPIRLVPVIREDQPPTKSGPLILRSAKREIGILDGWMLWPWQAKEQLAEGKIKAIVLVDDFLGTGKQLSKFLKSWGFENFLSKDDVTFCYAPVVAHEDGVNNLATQYPNLRISFAEVLRKKHSFFSPDNWFRMTRGEVSSDAAKAYFSTWCQENLPALGNVPIEGYGKLELTIGFAHGTPNNTLPIFWQDSPVGGPLLER